MELAVVPAEESCSTNIRNYCRTSAFDAGFPAYSRFFIFKISCFDVGFYEEIVYSIVCLSSSIALVNKKTESVLPKLLLKVEEENTNVSKLYQ